MKKQEFENKLRKVSKRIGYSFLVMVFVDFLLLNLFGESPETHHTFGWYVFIIWTILCWVTFVVFLFLLFFERISSYHNKKKEEEKGE